MRIAKQGLFWVFCAGVPVFLCAAQEPSIPPSADVQQGLGQVQQAESEEAADGNAETAVTPDSHALAGPMRLGVGSWGPRHSFFVPGFSTVESLDSNPMLTGKEGYHAFTSGLAQLHAVQYFGKDSELRYAGSIRFDTSARVTGMRQVANSQAMGLTKTLQLKNWTLSLNDAATYSQGSNFGDTGLEGMGTVISDLAQWSGNSGLQLDSTGMQSGLEPDQSILSLRASRISNTSVAEVDRTVGARGAATAAAFYGFLHFFDSGLIDGTQKGAMAGYEKWVSGRNRMGLLGGYTRMDFSGSPYALSTTYGNLMYGRTIAGRSAVQIGVGPEYLHYRAPQGSYSDVEWQGRGEFTYQMRQMRVQVLGMRMLTGGSGVLVGARTTEVQAVISRQLNRLYQVSGSFGVARNTALQDTESYDTQYLQTVVSRNTTRNVSAFLSYNLRNQTATGCGAAACSVTGFEQIFAVGLSWGGRAVGIR